MKKALFVLTAVFLCSFAYSEDAAFFSEDVLLNENLDPVTGFPVIKDKPFIMIEEGFTFAQVTRLEKQSGRSNFVWEDNMIGAYIGIQTKHLQPVDDIVRISVLYPFSHAFNDVEMVAKQTILYAFDLFAGPLFRGDFWKYVRLNFAAGLHYMYQLTDEYHLHYIGLGLLSGFEFPIAQHWSILMDGMFSLDYANLGSNRNIQTYDYAWQYHASLGVRYSKKGRNEYSYIDSRKRKDVAGADAASKDAASADAATEE